MSRRRFVFAKDDEGNLVKGADGMHVIVEVGADYVGAVDSGGHKSDAEKYDGLRATDGTPIDSGTKHRRYMKERGLALASDFEGTWAKAEERRAEIFTRGPDPKGISQAYEAAYKKLKGY